jgi:hypothetical protein
MTRVNESTRDYFFVATGDQNLATTGNLNTDTNTYNISSGQLGVVCDVHNLAHLDYWDFLSSTNNPGGSAANTADNVPQIRIVQGTPNAAGNSSVNGFFYEDEGKLISPPIKKDNILSFSAKIAPVQSNSSVFFTGIDTPVANQEYAFYLKLRSERKDKTYGRNTDDLNLAYSKNSYASYDDPIDKLLQELAYKGAVRSKIVAAQPSWNPVAPNKEVFPFLLNLGGNFEGVALGTIALGDQIPVMEYQGTTITYTADAAFLQTVNQWIANSSNITATTTIVPINLTTAGDKSVAGATITITNNTNLATDTVTIGTTGLVEGTDFDAGSDNTAAQLAVTATNLAEAINDADEGVTATASGAVVTIVANTKGTAGNSIVLTYTDQGSVGLTVATLGSGTLGGGDETNADGIVFMGLDHDIAPAYDDIANLKVTVSAEAGQYFTETTYTKTVVCDPTENKGLGRVFKIDYDSAAFAQTGSQQLAGHSDELLLAPNYIDEDQLYTCYVIDLQDTQSTLTIDVKHQKRLMILLPAETDVSTTDAATGVTASTSATTTVSDLEAILGAWLKSANPHQLGGAATSATYFS